MLAHRVKRGLEETTKDAELPRSSKGGSTTKKGNATKTKARR
jgi:hypothetical protein